MASPAKKTKASTIPDCPYGAGCYRKNPAHFVEFFHPKKSKTDDSDGSDDVDAGPSTSAAPASLPSTDDSSLPLCKYGAKCFRKNLLHFAEYSHPTKGKATTPATANDSDTDEISDEDVPPVKTKGGKKINDILNRGMSLVKTYSAMTETERKELIKKAFEAKKQLQDELEKTKKEVKEKAQEVEKLQKEVATGLLLMEGEKEALEGSKIVYFDLVAERSYKEGSADQTHFRLAESQFYRLTSGQANYRITKVEYVVNPELNKDFKMCRDKLKKQRGEEFSYPVLGFHGTVEQNIIPICETGFKIPGESKFKHRTDTGWYGKGVYFSEYPTYSMSYIQGSTKLLLCQVLPGKIFQCTKLIHGAALQKGYDSHTSPDKKELVIFNKYHILPSYIVHYTTAAGDFTYVDKVAEKKKKELSVKKGKTDKKGGTVDKDYFDVTELQDKCNKAVAKKASKALGKFCVQFTGTFQLAQKPMMELAVKHGASAGTKAVFNLLVATKEEYDSQTNKVQTAIKKLIPIVPEMFIYDCILKECTPKAHIDYRLNTDMTVNGM